MPIHKLSIFVICTCACTLAAIAACNNVNSQQQIDRIISAGSYQVSVHLSACFGNDTTILNIVKDGNVQKAVFTFAGDVETGGFSKKSGPLRWNADKEGLLKQSFATGIVNRNKQTCTSQAVYTLYTSGEKVAFTDDACTFDKRFEELMQ